MSGRIQSVGKRHIRYHQNKRKRFRSLYFVECDQVIFTGEARGLLGKSNYKVRCLNFLKCQTVLVKWNKGTRILLWGLNSCIRLVLKLISVSYIISVIVYPY